MHTQACNETRKQVRRILCMCSRVCINVCMMNRPFQNVVDASASSAAETLSGWCSRGRENSHTRKKKSPACYDMTQNASRTRMIYRGHTAGSRNHSYPMIIIILNIFSPPRAGIPRVLQATPQHAVTDLSYLPNIYVHYVHTNMSTR